MDLVTRHPVGFKHRNNAVDVQVLLPEKETVIGFAVRYIALPIELSKGVTEYEDKRKKQRK